MKMNKLDRAEALARYHASTLSYQEQCNLLEELLFYHFLTLDAEELSDYMEDEGVAEQDLREWCDEH